MTRTTLIIAAALSLSIGCSRQNGDRDNDKKDAPEPKSTAATVIDGFTGRTAVRAGRKAKDKLTKIGNERDEKLDRILGDQ